MRGLLLLSCVAVALAAHLEWYLWLRDQMRDIRRPGEALRTNDFGLPESLGTGEVIPVRFRKKLKVTSAAHELPEHTDEFRNQFFWPAPMFRAEEDDTLSFHIRNRYLDEVATVHYHGIIQVNTNHFDGVNAVTECSLRPLQDRTHGPFLTTPGTRWYHAHVGSAHNDGLQGALITDFHEDPYARSTPCTQLSQLCYQRGPARDRNMYNNDKVIALTDLWEVWEQVLLDLEFQTHDYFHFNGVWGDGSTGAPFGSIDVTTNQCYRLRIIAMFTDTFYTQLDIAGHRMVVIALDGDPIQSFEADRISVMPGERVDVLLCTGSAVNAASYRITINRYRNFDLFTGFIVDDTANQIMYAYMNYPGTAPPALGNAVADLVCSSGPGSFRERLFDAWGATGDPACESMVPVTNDAAAQAFSRVTNNPIMFDNMAHTPETPRNYHTDAALGPVNQQVILYLGWTGPIDNKWFFSPNFTPASLPAGPLTHTMAECGATPGAAANLVPIQFGDVIEVIMINISPVPHPAHLHGHTFQVMGQGGTDLPQLIDYDRNDFAGTFGTAQYPNPCPGGDAPLFAFNGGATTPLFVPPVADNDDLQQWERSSWGCPWNARYEAEYNLVDPYLKDTVNVPSHGWTSIRFRADNPGYWIFHCHIIAHADEGMLMVFEEAKAQMAPLPRDYAIKTFCNELLPECSIRRPTSPPLNTSPRCDNKCEDQGSRKIQIQFNNF